MVDQIDVEQALKCASMISDPRVAAIAIEVVKAFHPFAIEHGWLGVEVFSDLEVDYRISSSMKIPVRPTFVVNDSGRLIPYFVICWSKDDLTIYQRRILATAISETVLSLEGFENSSARLVFTPRRKYSSFQREIYCWDLSEYPILTQHEQKELFDIHSDAMIDAEEMIRKALS